MSKFSQRPVRAASHVMTTTPQAVVTPGGGIGWIAEAKTELFKLAVTNFVTEKTFYESAPNRDLRFERLIHEVTSEDPAWVRGFVPWLRNIAKMRSASIIVAAEYVKAGGENGRSVISAALKRADEPGEMLAYWHSRHGRRLPKPVKRGIADAVSRLYTEKNVLKWDGTAKIWRFADVVDMVHPKPSDRTQTLLFKYLLDARHDHAMEYPSIIAADKALLATPPEGRRRLLGGELWINAGWSWERLSGWIPGGMDAQAWEAVIPTMGYMALMRNLRNFDQAGISVDAYNKIVAKLIDPEEVAQSMQFPMRFLSAYKAVTGERWKYPLEQALNLSLNNVPALKGRTLIMVDVSGSMRDLMSTKSELERWEAASIFAAALALRAENADLVAYDDSSVHIAISPGMSVFKILEKIRSYVGGSTDTWGQTIKHFKNHDRVIILTDEQANSGYGDPGRRVIPLVHTFNLAGYKVGHAESGSDGRYAFAGLTDTDFKTIPLLEAAKDCAWPWEALG